MGRFIWFAVALTIGFGKSLFSLALSAVHDDLNSYIVLIPVVAAYLLYMRRHELPAASGRPSAWAFLPAILGLGGLIAAVNYRQSLAPNDYFTLTTFAFVCLLLTGGLFFLGTRWMLSAAFPFSFLFFMVPMPLAMAEALESGLKLASAEAASLFFDLTGTPVLREGTFFQLPNIAIEVARECSGVRSSWVLLITGLVASNLFLNSTWRRAILVCFVLPLGILRNGFRVFVIGSLCIRYGPQIVHSIIHRRGGPLFFVLSLIPLFALLWWLRRGEIKAQRQAVDDQTSKLKGANGRPALPTGRT